MLGCVVGELFLYVVERIAQLLLHVAKLLFDLVDELAVAFRDLVGLMFEVLPDGPSTKSLETSIP